RFSRDWSSDVCSSDLSAGVLGELPEGTGADDWFMDYRNGDGSIAEMCGNGVRVFAHYLTAHGFENRREFVVGSRAGGKPVTVHEIGRASWREGGEMRV